METVNSNMHLPVEVMMRMVQLLLELSNTYGCFMKISRFLKEEFKCLNNIPLVTLSDRVRHHHKKLYKFSKSNPLLPLIDTKHPSKTPVLTVSKKYLMELNLWHNTICLSGLNRVGNVLHYDGDVQIGSNVPFSEDIDISKINRECLLMIVDISDWFPGGECPSDYVCMSLSENHGPDDFVLVMISANHHIRHEQGQKVWDNMFVDKVQTCMNVTVKGDGKTHFKSVGKYYGFGWMAKSNMKSGCSYAKVKVKKEKKLQFKDLYDYLCKEVKCMAQTLDGIIPGVVTKGQCITQHLLNLCNMIGSSNCQKSLSFLDGMITGMVCQNAQTSESHFEKDCAFTLIGMPFADDGINTAGMFVFEFMWGVGKRIRIKLLPGTVIYYSAFGIMHRQISLTDWAQGQNDFKVWNIATYGNKAFYEHVLASLMLLLKNTNNH